MGRAIGIDLGTTFSRVAVIEGGEPKVIENSEGDRLTPSVVAVDKKGERLVGLLAKRQAVTNPENTIFSIKRLIGHKFKDEEVQYDIKRLPYKIVEASNGDARVVMGGKEYSSPEISAMILQKLKTDAEAYLGDKVTDAVIAVPAYFYKNQRQATTVAASIADLNVLRLINQPDAAALAYGTHSKQEETIAVYGLGGGTFDISVLELGEGTFQVKSTSGDTHLGGDDIDQRIMDWLCDEFKKESGIDLKQDRMALQRLKDAGEKAKRELSTVAQTEVNLPFVTADASGPKHLNITLTRAKLEQMSVDLLEKTIEPCRQALADAGLTPAHLSDVILVGGQTRMPKVHDIVRHFFGREPTETVNSQEAVVLGAAIQAGVLTGDVREILLLEATPFTLGIETLGGVSTSVIPRNTGFPTSASGVRSTDADNQPSVEIHVLQGERQMAGDNRTLGRFMLDGILPAPRGVPQIEVTFDIDANGTLNVRAQDKETGKEQKITISDSSGLSKEEVEKLTREGEGGGTTLNNETRMKTIQVRMDEDALGKAKAAALLADKPLEQWMTETIQRRLEAIQRGLKKKGPEQDCDDLTDAQKKEEVETRNTADTLVYVAERTLREQGDKIPDDLKQEVDSKIAAVRSALQGTHINYVRSTTQELSDVMQKIGAAVYLQAGSAPRGGEAPGAGAPGGEAPGEEPPGGEGTVEGEFREV